MPVQAPVADLAVTRLARRPLTTMEIHGLGRAALRTGAPKLLDVLALRATDGRYDAAALARHLDADGRWPDIVLVRPDPALALACQWAVGAEQIRHQPRARAAFGDLLQRRGPGVFEPAEAAAHLFAQLAYLAGDEASVRHLVEVLPLSQDERADLLLDLANPRAAHTSGRDPGVWLGLFNARFRGAGLAQVTVDDGAVHPFDGLSAPSGASVDGPLVSIVVPSFRPDEGLLNSIRSLRAQTYGNLEILLVDDASGPGFGDIYAEAAALDDRLTIVTMPVNGGSYLGRNEAFTRARGRFLTTQDADDWSHPDRIAHQVRLLQDNPLAPASRSDAIRALDDLTVTWLGYPSVRRNASSLMVRRSTVETVGVFDTVRKGADSEYHERVERRLGPTLDTLTPLAITRLRGGSLSRSDFRLLWMTPDRALYRAGFRAWHERILPGEPPLAGAEQLRRRSFPASWSFRRALPSAPPLTTRYDVIYLVDLASPSVLTAPDRDGLGVLPPGKSIALIFQEDPTLGRPRRPNTAPRAMSAVFSGRADLLSASDAASCDALVVLTPGLLEMPSLDAPAARASRIAALLTDPVDGIPMDHLAVLDGGRAVFGRDIEFVAIHDDQAATWSDGLGCPTRTLSAFIEDTQVGEPRSQSSADTTGSMRRPSSGASVRA